MNADKDLLERSELDISWIEPSTPSPLKVSVSLTENRTLMVLAGELDCSTVEHLRERFAEVENARQGDLVLDIGLLTFVDSTGLSLFLSEHRRLRAAGSNLVIFGPTPMAQRLFEITGFNQLLDIESFHQLRFSIDGPFRRHA